MSTSTVVKVSGADPYDIVIGRALLGEVAIGLGEKVRGPGGSSCCAYRIR